MTKRANKADARDLLRHFNASLGVDFSAPADLIDAAEAAIEGCSEWRIHGENERCRRLIALVNAKLKLNKASLQAFLDAAAKSRVFPNYHDKLEISECLDLEDGVRFRRWLERTGYAKSLLPHFTPMTSDRSLEHLHDLLRTGVVNRSDARTCDVSERRTEILRALFGSYVFHSFPTEAMHRHFNPECQKTYEEDYYKHLLRFYPQALHRDCALIYLRLTSDTVDELSEAKLRDTVCTFIRDSYNRLANHCVLAIQIPPFRDVHGEDGQWSLFSDVVLYAEKHREVPLQTGYFRPDEIEATTAGHIARLKTAEVRFDLSNEGFFFRDCFILADSQNRHHKSGEILLLFDKNQRDETVIPCPACRSDDVAGNSYPALGIRSWECRNPICPERSAFDRGCRYSLSAIIKQEAIKSEADKIPDWSLKRWKLDVVSDIDANAISDMLVRHYSLHNDTVVFVNAESHPEKLLGRKIIHEVFDPAIMVNGLSRKFQSSAFFRRFVVERDVRTNTRPVPVPHHVPDAIVFNGDCFDVLSALEESSIDGAVTSPPYYNARSYSTWPNIYCYLYDMYNAARQVYRTLKPGAYYLFNIFDYFDNENSIVFSAMGKKRMILGAYIVNLFRRIGFEIHGNAAWYKGEIEGKRNYNQGNRSPYYQAPLNCWEHCFVFRKPGNTVRAFRFPAILDAKPVYKMVRGENVLGHTAPFPPDIPAMVISQMPRGSCILDPFSGSMTTGRTANRYGVKSISVEMLKEYCDLGIRLLAEECGEGGNRRQIPGLHPTSYRASLFD